MEIRVGDVVRLIPLTVTEVYDDGDMCFKEDVGLISPDLVEAVIAHAETDAEKIARLEARVKELESVAVDSGPLTKTTNDGKIDGSEPEDSRYPPHLEGHGPWMSASDLQLEMNLYRMQALYKNGAIVAYCRKLP